MGGGGSAPQFNYPPPQPPDPFATAQAQTGYTIQAAEAQNLLNNVNQVTPYGSINYNQTGSTTVPGTPAVAGKANTGGYWNGQMWIPTGGSPGSPAGPDYQIPTYTATTSLSPAVQSVVDQQIAASGGAAGLENQLIGQVQNQKPLDLSWGNLQNNIFGLEKNTLDPQWAQNQQVNDQSLANQGLTPGSQGWNYQQTQFGINKANAYNQAMLQAQNQASSDIQAQYASPYNTLASLRGTSQIAQPGVGQPAQTATANIPASNYAGIATSNYATGANIFNSQQQLQEQQYQAQQQQQNQLMGGLFGLGGNLLGALPALIGSDRRDKTDIKRLGIEPETKLPMYSYRYKGDPKTYPKVVGPMAQDVEKIYPERVGEVEGHKVIFGLGA